MPKQQLASTCSASNKRTMRIRSRCGRITTQHKISLYQTAPALWYTFLIVPHVTGKDPGSTCSVSCSSLHFPHCTKLNMAHSCTSNETDELGYALLHSLFGVFRYLRIRWQCFLHDSAHICDGQKPVLLPYRSVLITVMAAGLVIRMRAALG